MATLVGANLVTVMTHLTHQHCLQWKVWRFLSAKQHGFGRGPESTNTQDNMCDRPDLKSPDFSPTEEVVDLLCMSIR